MFTSACVVASTPHVPAFVSGVCCLPALADDWTAGTPCDSDLPISLIVRSPQRMVDWITASWSLMMLGEGDECEVETGCGCGHGAQPSRMPLNSQMVQEHATFSLSSWIASPQSGQMS
jgi:hypothetical protein